jgi:hypothetical protein
LIVGGAGAHSNAKPILIYGAGDRAEFLLGEILNNPEYSTGSLASLMTTCAK